MILLMKLILKSKCGLHYAEAIYKEGVVTVLKGSRVNRNDSYQRMASEAVNARRDKNIVGESGEVLKDVSFNSPSTAAQFVTGRSSNGYIAWRPDDRMSLKEYLRMQENK